MTDAIRGRLVANDHCFDAFISCLVAYAAATNATIFPDGEQQLAAARQGAGSISGSRTGSAMSRSPGL